MRPFKGIICDDISEFESHMPSHAVRLCGSCVTCGEMRDSLELTSAAPRGAPLFTCFGSANEGLPRNPNIPFYYETKPDAFDYTPNPASRPSRRG